MKNQVESRVAEYPSLESDKGGQNISILAVGNPKVGEKKKRDAIESGGRMPLHNENEVL